MLKSRLSTSGVVLFVGLSVAVSGAFVASCGNAPGAYAPTNGGHGSVINAGGADASVDASHDSSGDGSAVMDVHKDAPVTEIRADVAQALDGSAGADGAIAPDARGSAGTGPIDDPCVACEKARCSHPSGITAGDITSSYAQVLGAFSMCFTGTGLPASEVDPTLCAAQISTPGPVAMAGPAMGSQKSTLCQALLKCVHASNCADGDCFCGPGVSAQMCADPAFKPMGACVDEVENGSETTEVTGATGIEQTFFDACLATSSAFTIVDFCDANCCPTECHVVNGGDPDPGYCNAPGTSGTAGTSGGAGTSGAAGTNGAAGTTAAAGTNGAAGTTAAAGTNGAAGTTAAAGTNGAAGTTAAAGTNGAAGTTGVAGTTGAPTVVMNATFDTGTDHWTATSSIATVSRSPNDADGKTPSGPLSLAVTAGNPNGATQSAAVQCVSVSAGAAYAVSASVLVPGSTGSAGSVGLWFYTSPDCTGAQSTVTASSAAAANTWQRVTGSATAPAGAQSMAVRLLVLKPAGQQAAEALFDDVQVTRQ